ncbi:hypothetical protein JMUB6875_30800 [Nocardia sp. JMUB6875]|uniref:PaaI family thioesterase n=1 Tax=Nocardia sp. JMUB6875 TaxID=3158170 RepID=UPI0032E67B32
MELIEGQTLNDAIAAGSSCWACGPVRTDGLLLRYLPEGPGVGTAWYADPLYHGAPGRLHNGIVAVLLEEVAGWAGYRALTDAGISLAGLAIADLAVEYRGPVPTEVWVALHGEAESLADGLVRTRAELRVEDTVLATATCTLRTGQE